MFYRGKALYVGNSGKLRLTIVLLSIVLLPVLSACMGGEPAPDNSPSKNVVLLRNAVEGMKALKSYHFSAVVGTPPRHVEMAGDVDVANSRAMLVMTTTGQVANVIVIGQDVYVSEGGSAGYTKAASSDLSLDSVLGMWGRFKPEDIDRARDALRDGTPAAETIDGVSTKHIVGDAGELNALTNAGSETEQEGSVEFWVSTDANPYVYQMRVDGKSGGHDIAGTFKWSRFNETFDVKAP